MIDAAEFAELRAYLTSIEPAGDDRADAHAALIASTIAAAHGAKGRMVDYLLDFKPRIAQTAQDREASIKMKMEQVRAVQKARMAEGSRSANKKPNPVG